MSEPSTVPLLPHAQNERKHLLFDANPDPKNECLLKYCARDGGVWEGSSLISPYYLGNSPWMNSVKLSTFFIPFLGWLSIARKSHTTDNAFHCKFMIIHFKWSFKPSLAIHSFPTSNNNYFKSFSLSSNLCSYYSTPSSLVDDDSYLSSQGK